MAKLSILNKSIIVFTWYHTWDFFHDLIDDVIHINDLSHFQNIDRISSKSLILFEGGEDISPELYEEKSRVLNQQYNRHRDFFEREMFLRAIKVKAPMLGICRGSQFLTAMNGGKVIQHVNGHIQYHMIETFDDALLSVTSTHHQMMNPFNLAHENYRLIAWSTPKQSDVYLNGDNEQVAMPVEPEIVWYPKTKCLCIQGHPEYLFKEDEFVIYSRKLIKQYLL